MRYLMGVDGGGSKTYTVITDENGNKLGEGISGRGNHQALGIEPAFNNIKESIDKALSSAGLYYKDISFTQFGLAGADRKKDFSILRPALNTLPLESFDLVCDTFEGLRIGSENNVGVVLVCGSGTNAAGRNKEGKVVQTGGFGFFYGDAAGGKHMARETFRSAVRSWELREMPSLLTDTVPKFFGFQSMEQLVNDFLDRDIFDVPGELTITLHEAAAEGDPLAIQILSETGAELGAAANSVIKRLGGFEGDTIPVILVGSVLQKAKNEHLLQAMQTAIERERHSVSLIIPDMEPVYGSILLAMDHLGIETSDDIYQKFRSYKRE
ncbi:N-acetylglucosamine kinase-like BadF-type ATPase [Peribacillus deserti]|uniref:N-acetylglucosamine kinase-like BadF-type ATPase n=1 Tax=Peribacillus deserti TaxID=673318 RepID=A0ABS2QF17_9BACI|nr:BadF/BadG/BcrA/BcrD ATPase family protein [Peribacillus deserti]MBM7691746.1 N-acetylglucosamine kinase-like BadF-type ATPase [Peribacillus deserti]